MGCDKGNLYVYQRKNNGKANLLFDELCLFKPHNDSILQIKKLISGHILTLCGDASAKILKIDHEISNI